MCTPHVHARVHVQNDHASKWRKEKVLYIFTSTVYEANRSRSELEFCGCGAKCDDT
jgi:hypothetical protein